ncbi:MAG: helicase-related protein, partial [Panacagrimonas sp.]
SSGSMVPDAVAALLSYEAERRMGVGKSGRRYFEHHRLRPLQFRQDQGRLTGLRALLLIYPSPTLAELADPLAVFTQTETNLSMEGMRAAVCDRLKPALDALQQGAVQADHSNSAEWAAPAVIDELLGTRSLAWLKAPTGMHALASEDAFQDHVAELSVAATARDLGSSYAALSELLVDVSLGSPAVCALRALKRIALELPWDAPCLLSAAAKVAWTFRSLFNQHDAIALLRQDSDEHYWRSVLAYCAKHNLQAVLDEYAHYLVDAEGLGTRSAEERAVGVADAMASALAIRPSQIDVDDVHVDGAALAISKFQMRGRFAMRLADYKDEDGAVARLGGVRDAFNSPFRPFVLATTSVGQEGLDFHPYCYRVYHWNLPGNPVDLEQREGRVHRFKCHAVRLNLAERQVAAVRGGGQITDDPWKLMFARARSEASVDTDIVPYWIYEGSVRVERRVPMLPFSREIARLAWLKRSLIVYRLAFGQPRQDDLLNYLQALVGECIESNLLRDLQIGLEPKPSELLRAES